MFEGIWSALTSIGSVFGSFIGSFFSAIGFIFSMPAVIGIVISVMPSVLAMSISYVLAICIMKFILGR